MGKIDKLEMLKDLVQDAIDEGATSVEEIHKKIADLLKRSIEKSLNRSRNRKRLEKLRLPAWIPWDAEVDLRIEEDR